jgi:TolB-like protein
MQDIRGPSSKRLPARPPHLAPAAQMRGDDIDKPAVNDNALWNEQRRGGARIGILPPRCVGLPDDTAFLGPSLANEITTALSRFRWISVVSSNSLARFARDNHDVAALRRTRGIDLLLDGAIQRSRNNLRVTLRLLDLRQDNQVVWARRFDRPADDPLSVQEEISGEVAAQLEPIILLTEARRGAVQQDAEISAYHLILRAAPLIARLERAGFMRAGEHLESAIALEPDHGSAHAWYAAWHTLLISQGWDTGRDAIGERAGELAERAIVLDSYSAGAFAVTGHVRAVVQHNPHAAATLYERALELNPNLAAAWALSAINQVFVGDRKEAERRYQRYRLLSPLDPYSFMFDGLFASLHVLNRDYQAAAAIGRSVTQLNPSYSAGYKPYLAALGHLGGGQEAGSVLRRLLTIEPAITVERCAALFPMQRPEDRDHFAAGLRLAGMR